MRGKQPSFLSRVTVRQLLLLLTVLFTTVGSLYAQTLSFTNYSANDGLSNNTVLCIAQDKRGFMWFGTGDSLARFDGIRFKSYFPANPKLGANSDFIMSLKADKKGDIWAGMRGGIFRYDAAKDQLLPFIDTIMDIRRLFFDHNNNLWFGSGDKLYYFDDHTRQLKLFLKGLGASISNIEEYKGALWVSTLDGLISIIDLRTKVVQSVEVFDRTQRGKGFALNNVYPYSDSTLLLATRGRGVLCINTNTWKISSVNVTGVRMEDYDIWDIVEGNRGNIWVATLKGLLVYNPTTLEGFKVKNSFDNPFDMHDQICYSIFRDREDGIWIGTYYGGVSYFNNNGTARFSKYLPGSDKGSLKGSIVNKFREDAEGKIWILSDAPTLGLLDPKTGYISQVGIKNPPAAINGYSNIDIAFWGDLLYWVTSKGVLVLNKRTREVIKTITIDRNKDGFTAPDITCALLTSAGNLILGGRMGAYEYLPESGGFMKLKPADARRLDVAYLREAGKGKVWVGTYDNGLALIDLVEPSRSRRLPLRMVSGKRTLDYAAMFIDKTGMDTLWVAGGPSGLLYLVPPYDTVQQKQEFNGAITKLYTNVEASDGSMWVGANNGLLRFEATKTDFVTYTRSEGLARDEFNFGAALRSSTGRLYFGTADGFISLMPSDFDQRFPAPPIYITEFKLNRQPLTPYSRPDILSQSIELMDQVVLNYKDATSIEIGFSALSYTSPMAQHYEYMMEGLDDNWTPLDRVRNAYFTRLQPGEYVFKVRAKTNDHVQTSVRELRIIVKPPFWRSTVAYIFYGLVVFFIFLGAVRLYDQKEKRKREEAAYQDKLAFYTNAAHEIKTPLTLIRGPLENITDHIDAYPELKEDLLLMNEHTDKLLTLVNQLLDFRKVESSIPQFRYTKVNIGKLVEKVLVGFTKSHRFDHVRVHFEGPDTACYILTDESALMTIFNNLISNAFKFAESEVDIILSIVGDDYSLKILNDGSLISDKDADLIFSAFVKLQDSKYVQGSGVGLSLALQLANLLKMNLFFGGAIGGKNLFVLEIPGPEQD